MHSLAFEPQPSQAAAKHDTSLLLRRRSSVWIQDDVPSEIFYEDEEVCCTNESTTSLPCLKWPGSAVSLSMVALLVLSWYMGSVNARRPLELKLREAEEIRRDLLDQQAKLLAEKAQLDRLPKVNEALSRTIENLKQNLEEKERALEIGEHERAVREEAFSKLLGKYSTNNESREASERQRNDLAKLIKTMAYDHYGGGTQNVEFHVRIWEDGEPWDETFTVEVAGFEVMPISSFMFLQQVEHGLWDGTSFYMNAPHVLMAQPLSKSNDVYRLPQMEKMGLARLPVPEYSPSMPHVKYTLGFGSSLATAGSFFFINKIDNSYSQAGQPCFGRVVKGFDIVDRIISLESGAIDYRIQPVDIVSIRLVRSTDDLEVEL